MKKIFITIITIGLFFTSCSDELDVNPITEKEASNFFKTEVEIEEAVNGVYATLQFTGLYNLYLPVLGELPSDNTFDEVPSNDGGIFGQLDEFTTITSNAIITRTWREAYIGIQRANTVLNRIEAVNFQNEAVKNARKGEMKFIRALLYFNLVQIYGDVPLVIEETTDPSAYFGQGRTPKDQVYAQIVKDLNEAITELPLTASRPGRVIKTAVEGLLGKVYLTLKNYTQAKIHLQNVVNSNQHTLLEDAAAVFDIENELNAEILFSVQFASGINGNSEGSDAFQQFSASGTINGAKGHNLPTRSFFTLYTDDDIRKGVYLGATSEGVPFSRKYKKPDTAPNDGGSDWVVLRYADILLMLAEVENELSNTAAAATHLNAVRNRAKLSNTTVSTQTEMREAIDLERRLELIGEGHRWFDLLRTGRAIEVMNAWFAKEGINISIDQNDLLMPIPQSQIDTDPALRQNPGY